MYMFRSQELWSEVCYQLTLDKSYEVDRDLMIYHEWHETSLANRMQAQESQIPPLGTCTSQVSTKTLQVSLKQLSPHYHQALLKSLFTVIKVSHISSKYLKRIMKQTTRAFFITHITQTYLHCPLFFSHSGLATLTTPLSEQLQLSQPARGW